MEKSVTLIIRYKDADGVWQRSPAARGMNGRVKPGHALVDGKAMPVSQGLYQIRYFKDRKLKYVSAGRNAAEADAQRARIERQTAVRAAAADAGLVVEPDEDRKTLSSSAADYIADAEQRGASEAASQARLVCAEFQAVVKRTYVHEVTRQDILAFHVALRKRGCQDRTVANKDARLRSWLRFAGVDNVILPPKPKYEAELPTIYSPDQISSLFGSADDQYMTVLMMLALTCGLRDQELIHLEWLDVDLRAKVLLVRSKIKHGFKVKDSEQRELPLTDELIAGLIDWRDKRMGFSLVLGTKSDKPNYKLLRALKRMAKRAGLNCGHCDGCKGRQGECQEWNLHRFRRTYATTLLRNGVDLATVQKLMGHSDLASTMRYLRPATGEALQSKVSTIKWGM